MNNVILFIQCHLLLRGRQAVRHHKRHDRCKSQPVLQNLLALPHTTGLAGEFVCQCCIMNIPDHSSSSLEYVFALNLCFCIIYIEIITMRVFLQNKVTLHLYCFPRALLYVLWFNTSLWPLIAGTCTQTGHMGWVGYSPCPLSCLCRDGRCINWELKLEPWVRWVNWSWQLIS